MLSISSLVISGQALNLAPQANQQNLTNVPYGYRFQPPDDPPPGSPAVVELTGGAFFYPGRQNVVVSYTAGYQVTSEAQTVPASPSKVTPLAPFGIWATDQGVKDAATGLVLTPVPTNPATGQYVPPAPDGANPVLSYTFAVADVGRAVLLSYGYVPGDIEQVALEIVSERAAVRGRVGIRSQSLGGQESTTYDTGGLNKFVVDSLRPYVSVLPPAIGAAV